MKIWIAIVALVAFSHSAVAADSRGPLTIFGIEIGKPLSLPRCKYEDDPPVCLAANPFRMPQGNSFVDAQMESFDHDFIVLGNRLHIELLDGKVEYVTFKTEGIATRDADLRKLEEKWGQPDSTSTERSYFRGEEIPEAVYHWNFDGSILTYRVSIDGSVKAESSKFLDWTISQYKQREGKKPKL